MDLVIFSMFWTDFSRTFTAESAMDKILEILLHVDRVHDFMQMIHHNLAEGLVNGKKSHKQLQSAADTSTPRQFSIASGNIINVLTMRSIKTLHDAHTKFPSNGTYAP